MSETNNPARILGELIEREGFEIDDATFAEAAAVLEAEVERLTPELCFICNKPKGQPPDRCPGHYLESPYTPGGNYCSICNLHDQWCPHIQPPEARL